MASLPSLKSQTKPHRLLAPTYHVTVEAQRSESDNIHFRGASNLPAGSNIAIQVTDFYHAGWNDYSDLLCASLDERGFLEGDIYLKKGMKFHTNLILRANFGTQLCKQPSKTLEILGKHGEQLANVEDSKVPYEELDSHSHNPQLIRWSGWY